MTVGTSPTQLVKLKHYPESSDSDHYPLILSIPSTGIAPSKLFRFEPSWLQHEDLLFRFEPSWLQHEDLYANMEYWWNETPLEGNLAKGWIKKITRVRRKLKG
jgi:hypothetical protein